MLTNHLHCFRNLYWPQMTFYLQYKQSGSSTRWAHTLSMTSFCASSLVLPCSQSVSFWPLMTSLICDLHQKEQGSSFQHDKSIYKSMKSICHSGYQTVTPWTNTPRTFTPGFISPGQIPLLQAHIHWVVFVQGVFVQGAFSGHGHGYRQTVIPTFT